MSNIPEPFISNRTRTITILCCIVVATGLFNGVYWLWLPAVVVGGACKMADKRSQKSIEDKEPAPLNDTHTRWIKQNEIGCVVGRSEGKSHLDKLSRL